MPGGISVIHDFSAGRRFRGNKRLEKWYLAFERRYPAAPGCALEVRDLSYGRSGLHLEAYEELEVALHMNLDSYLAYALSETGVESAIARGVTEAEIRDWCQSTLWKVFGDEAPVVIFDSYIAYVRRGQPLNIL